jgi:RimJ/RimL family protein N-acetyltransferase
LVFLYVDRVLVGVAALKRPTATHRDSAFRGAGSPADASAFRLELGWAFVPLEYRRKGYSRVLASAAMSQADGAPAFATTRADNTAMKTTLEHLGFAQLGRAWKSKRGVHKLVLYVALSNKNS